MKISTLAALLGLALLAAMVAPAVADPMDRAEQWKCDKDKKHSWESNDVRHHKVCESLGFGSDIASLDELDGETKAKVDEYLKFILNLLIDLPSANKQNDTSKFKDVASRMQVAVIEMQFTIKNYKTFLHLVQKTLVTPLSSVVSKFLAGVEMKINNVVKTIVCLLFYLDSKIDSLLVLKIIESESLCESTGIHEYKTE
ncbi:uncharacterized protein LOC124353892 isoform X3 [Homalodisca vitripennis]|uniref:uncharacterized protein LOC124353892 isoform X3 n=1 Tax=Homalodisca vitripennis TaxID=197043 RepID=UPI001EEBD9EA|nr:uncharacterized protein LOC124353892 isoform X3 [Homalodisca vitripennis]